MPGLNINGTSINSLMYADDTVVLVESQEELQQVITKLNTLSNNFGLSLNIKKTKTIMINRENDQNIQVNIMINGESLESVQEYVYLGHTITSDGKCETEIRKRVGMAKSALAT
jgi:hypothetical protein